VKKPYCWSVLAAALVSLGCLTTQAVGQAPARAPAAPPMAGQSIALLDVTYIFKNHPRFKGMMEEMRADVQRAENAVKVEREQIAKEAEDLQATFRKGTPDYKAAEEKLANRQAQLAVNVNRQKSDFLQREAKIYNAVYQEIWQVTDYYCKQNGIGMVMKFNGDPADVDRPDTVLAKINQQVVWYQERMDITPVILKELSRAPAANPNAASRPGVQLPPR
jgi:Skp family chaperone for outer membrane proteins